MPRAVCRRDMAQLPVGMTVTRRGRCVGDGSGRGGDDGFEGLVTALRARGETPAVAMSIHTIGHRRSRSFEFTR